MSAVIYGFFCPTIIDRSAGHAEYAVHIDTAAVAIAERILTEGAPAVADYKRFLSGGSSTDPISLLKIAGVDMSRPESIDSALALFGELIDELDKLS